MVKVECVTCDPHKTYDSLEEAIGSHDPATVAEHQFKPILPTKGKVPTPSKQVNPNVTGYDDENIPEERQFREGVDIMERAARMEAHASNRGEPINLKAIPSFAVAMNMNDDALSLLLPHTPNCENNVNVKVDRAQKGGVTITIKCLSCGSAITLSKR